MRLVFDAFPCQTASRLRGIGRYTQSLIAAMARTRGGHDMYVLANALYPQSVDALRQQFRDLLPPGRFCAYASTHPAAFGNDRRAYEQVAAALIHRAYEDLAPDAVVYGNPFEGWHEPGVVAMPNGNLPSALRAGVLYDLIPWMFQGQYLDPNPGYKVWYTERLRALREFDLLLAISEASRRDAIEILGLPEDRVVNISGSMSSSFRPEMAELFHESHLATLGITRPFVLYTGNGDYRKNQDGLLRAYARLPEALRRSHQLVLNQVGDRVLFKQKTQSLGLTSDEVVVTGHVSDDELGFLYARCTVFVFPSLYEGFGLPILEAMACGAPVIAANNSSIPEVAGRDDILFDASSPEAIASALESVLVDNCLRKELSEYGLRRAKEFSWKKSAEAAWEAITCRVDGKTSRGKPDEVRTIMDKRRIALVVALDDNDPSAEAAVLALLHALTPRFEIDLFVQDGAQARAASLTIPVDIATYASLAERYDDYATCVYRIADTPGHAGMLPLIEASPGVIVMQETDFPMMIDAISRTDAGNEVFANERVHTCGTQGLIAFLKGHRIVDAPVVNRRILESALRLIVQNEGQKATLEIASRTRCHAWLPPITVLSGKNTDDDEKAIVQAIWHAIDIDRRRTIEGIADALEHRQPDETALATVAAHAASNTYLRTQPRLLIDVTQLARTDARSGIQRVVRNIVKESGLMPDLHRPLEIVRQDGGKLWRATEVIGTIFEIDPDRIPSMEVPIHPGDVLLMIDSSWEQYAEFSTIFQHVRLYGGTIVTVVYDLIPLRLPATCHPGLVTVFRHWFGLAAAQSDTLLCISRSVAEDVKAYLDENPIPRNTKLDIAHWPLGADISLHMGEAAVRPQVRDLANDTSAPLFLMVGTVEPRKGHAFVLDVFETLWRNGDDVRLCIAGGVGWMVDDVIQRIRAHPRLNEKLFFVEKFTDAEIDRCYSAATALIAASVAEGFGLPIVEAALHHVPTIASDIPVFREVGGDGALYFSLDDNEDLIDKIKAVARMPRQDRKNLAALVKLCTWQESARKLLDIILAGDREKYDAVPGQNTSPMAAPAYMDNT